MRIIDCDQGTEIWRESRCGVITASQAHRLFGAKNEGYFLDLLVERIHGSPADESAGGWAARGHEVEPEARSFYAMLSGHQVEQVGFCLSDDGSIGYSPDGHLKGIDKGLEIKCPSLKNHLAYVLAPEMLENGNSKLRLPKHGIQPQFSMFVSGYSEWDLISFCPALMKDTSEMVPPVIRTIWPDADMHSEFAKLTSLMVERLDEAVDKIRSIDPMAGLDENSRATLRVFG